MLGFHVGVTPAYDSRTTVRATGVHTFRDLSDSSVNCEMPAVICLNIHRALDIPKPLDPVILASGLMGDRMARLPRVHTVIKPTKSDSHRSFGTRMCPPSGIANTQRHSKHAIPAEI